MNYAGKFDATLSADGPGTHVSPAYIHIDSPHAQVPKDAIVVQDAHLLFNADFRRSGLDLILSKDDHELVLHDYFKGEKRAPLASPDGAHLTGDLVNALTGAVQYSQAGGAPAAASQVIGHVTKIAGNATAIRNGVSIILHQGDNVEKGDIVQAGADSTLGITFIDGTVFGLASNARMVLNEMVYDPNGSNNSSLVSLVAGTISFVAGETAKHGDMKIDTPVATMGIRGTAVLVEIDFTVPQGSNQPDAKFQVLVEPDGTTGSYILFDKTTLQPIAVVNQAGQQVNISNGVVSTSASQLSPDLQKLIADVFTQKFASSDTHSNTHFSDSVDPNLITGPTIRTANNTTATPIFQVTGSTTGSSSSPANTGSNGLQHVDQAPTATAGNGAAAEILKTTGSNTLDLAFNSVTFNDINKGDQPTVSTSFDHFTYTDAHGNPIANLNALQTADIKATEVDLVVVQGPGNTNIGTATWSYLIPDHAFDFLAAGETLTLTYTALVDSNYAPEDLKTPVPFTITITGTNDAPVITTGPETVAFAGGKGTSGGNLPTVIPGAPTTGTLAFADVDLTDTHTVKPELTTATLSGAGVANQVLIADGQLTENGLALAPTPLQIFESALSAVVTSDSTGSGNGTITWTLAELPVYLADFIPDGKTLTLTYTVTVTDSQGATSTQDVIVTIGGTAAAAEVWIATTQSDAPPGGLWSDGSNWETGLAPTKDDDAIIITNQLIGLTPSYPVTINAPAFAKSVTMNDFDDTAPELDNNSTLTIGGTFDLITDAIVKNAGAISVGGLMEVENASRLTNSGKLTLSLGGDFKDQSSITNTSTGTIDVTGGTLNVLVDVANSGKLIVETGATLALSAATIDGGTLTIDGTLDLQGTSFLKNGTLINNNQVNVTDTGNALENEKVTNNGNIDIAGVLLVDPTTIDNTRGTITVDGFGTLTLNAATITGGMVTNNSGGEIDLTGNGVIQSGSLGNSGTMVVTNAGNALHGETVTANNMLEVKSGGALSIDQTSKVANGATQVDSGGALTLNDATITGGTVTNDGTLDLSGTAVIDPGTLNNSGQINVSGAGNTLDGETVTNTGTIEVFGAGGALTLENSTVSNATDEAHNTGIVEVAAGAHIDLDNATILHGSVSILAGGTIETVSGTSNTIETANGPDNLSVVTLDIAGILAVTDNSSLALNSPFNIENSGTIELNSTGHSTYLYIDQGFAGISGRGQITLSNSIGNIIAAKTSGDQLTNFDNSISGAGEIGAGGLVLVNGDSGVINADVSHSLTLDPTALTNSGLIEATNGGTLELSATVVTNFLNAKSGEFLTDLSSKLDVLSSSIEGGTLVNYGTLDSSGTSAITNVTITNDGTIEATSGVLTIDPVNNNITNSGFIEANGGGLNLTGETVANTGTLEAVNGSLLALNNTTVNNGSGGTVEAADPAQSSLSTVTLQGATISGGTVATVSGGIIDATGDSNSIDGAIINNAGTLESTGGTLTIDAASTVNNTGLLEANGGSLIVDAAFSGSAEIVGASLLELGASSANAYSSATITFAADSAGTLKLDHAETFSGTVSGLDDNRLDLGDITSGANTTVTFSGGTLTVVNNSDPSQVAHIKLTGDYLGSSWIATSDGPDGGTSVTEIPGAITSGLDSQGNASEGSAVTTLITDGGKSVTGAVYEWQIFDTAQHKWVDGSGTGVNSAIYTPGEQDEGHALRVILTFSDPNGNTDQTTVSAGTVNPVADQPVVTASAATIDEDNSSALTLTFTNAPDLFENSDDSVTVTVTLDHGAVLHGTGVTDNHDGTFTLTATSVADLNGLTITPASEFEGSVTVGVSAVAHDGTALSVAGTTSTTLVVNPVADQPVVTASAATTSEVGTSALIITLTNAADLFENADDSVTITVSLSEGAVLNGTGVTDNHDGTFTLTASSVADLNGLTITPASEFEGDVSIGISAVAHDGAAVSAAGTTATTLTVTPIPEPPVVTLASTSLTIGEETGSTLLGISVTTHDADDTLDHITITGVPGDATLTSAADQAGISYNAESHAWTVAPAALADLTLNAGEDTSATLHITATTLGAEGATSADQTITLTVTPIQENPVFSGAVASSATAEGGLVTLGAAVATHDADDGAISVTITGLAHDLGTFSGGTYTASSGSWTGSAAQFNALTFQAGENGVQNLTITATTSGADAGSTVESYTLTVKGSAPVVDLNEDTSGFDNVVSLGHANVAPILIARDASITDTESSKLVSMTVELTNPQDNSSGGGGNNIKETLSLTSSAAALAAKDGLIVSFTSAVAFLTDPVTLSITGSASLADYQAILQGVQYADTKTGSHNTTDRIVTVVVNDGTLSSVSHSTTIHVAAPAGAAGDPINLALADPSADHLGPVTLTIAGIPSGWSLSDGSRASDGSWTVTTKDVAALSVASPNDYTGALVLNAAISWTNVDGSIGSMMIPDNVEVYAKGAPIFALAGDDNLTGAGENDLFVFGHPIGHDIIYNFNTASDKIDLMDFAGVSTFADIQGHIVDNADGNAVITVGTNETITLNGVHAASLTASDFVFNQAPVTENAGSMTIGDGAIMPLSGIINNTGNIELNSVGNETDLQLTEHGVTLDGSGQVILSDSGENFISGTSADVTLTNLNNTILGAGKLGAGQLTLTNEGTIDATGTNSLIIDTGVNAVTNSGTLEATGSGGLVVQSDVVNTGVLWANGGNVTLQGEVSGNGTAKIDGAGTLDFEAPSTANVVFGSGATGTLKLGDSFHFNGTISGFADSDTIDLANVGSATASISYHENAAGTGGTLTISDGLQTAELSLQGNYSADNFSIKPDHTTGTLITYVSHDLIV